jgi:hypothetical protein
MGTQIHPQIPPGIKVVPDRHRSLIPLGPADRPELGERPGSIDGRSICPRGSVDVVGAPVAVDLPPLSGARGGIVGAEALDDVVLNKRIACPAVHGQVAVAVGGVVAGEVDGTVGFAMLDSR